MNGFNWHYYNGHTPEGYSWMVCFFRLEHKDKSGLFLHAINVSPGNKVRTKVLLSRSCLDILSSKVGSSSTGRYTDSYLSHLADIYSDASPEVRDEDFSATDKNINAWGCSMNISDTKVDIEIPDMMSLSYLLNRNVFTAENEEKEVLQVNDYISYPRLDVDVTCGARRMKGKGWYDYESSSKEGALFSTGWTWLSLSIQNKDLCCYKTATISKCKIYEGNTVTETTAHELEVNQTYYDIASFSEYPDSFTLFLDGHTYMIQTRSRECILTSIAIFGSYYEGPVIVYENGIQVGKGFLEYLPAFEEPNPSARKFFGNFPSYVTSQIDDLYTFKNRSLYTLNYPGVKILDSDLDYVTEPVQYTTSLLGGCWRSALISLCCKILTDNPEAMQIVDRLLAIVEISQAASLMIDDIQDRSLTRRNKPCAYKVYGEEICYLAGELTSFHYIDIVSNMKLTGERKFTLIQKIQSAIKMLHLGQVCDLKSTDILPLFETFLRFNRKEEIIARISSINCMKTAVSAAMVFELGAIVGSWYNHSVNEETILAFEEMGMTIGLIYQTLNDLEDIVHKNGDDLKDNKVTAPMILALVDEEDVVRLYIGSLISNTRKSPENIIEVLSYLRSRNVVEKTLSYISDIFTGSWNRFSLVTTPSVQKLQLRAFCDMLLKWK